MTIDEPQQKHEGQGHQLPDGPHLQDDGTVFPPVTPDPPAPPGYRSPLDDHPGLLSA